MVSSVLSMLQQVMCYAATITLAECVFTCTFQCAKGMHSLKDALWAAWLVKAGGLKGAPAAAADPTTAAAAAAAARPTDTTTPMVTETINGYGTMNVSNMKWLKALLETCLTSPGQSPQLLDILNVVAEMNDAPSTTACTPADIKRLEKHVQRCKVDIDFDFRLEGGLRLMCCCRPAAARCRPADCLVQKYTRTISPWMMQLSASAPPPVTWTQNSWP